ncbi:7944_t:CDS:1, partial [Racocetra persica]
DLLVDQQQQIQNLLYQNIRIFAEKISKMGQIVGLRHINLIYYEINTKNTLSIKQYPY